MNWWGFLKWLSAYLSHRNHHHPLEAICLCLTCAWPLMIATSNFAVRGFAIPGFHVGGTLTRWGPRFIGKAPFLEVTLTVGGDLERLRKLLEDKDLRSARVWWVLSSTFSCVGHQRRLPVLQRLQPFGSSVHLEKLLQLLRLICKLGFLNGSKCSYCF